MENEESIDRECPKATRVELVHENFVFILGF